VTDLFLPFGSREYLWVLLLLLVARGADFFSTWTATPRLKLEANPIARWLGWRWGIGVNVLLCVGLALWLLPSVMVITTSLLVAARNFQSAWLIRTMGETGYRHWLGVQITHAPRGLMLFCLGAQSLIYGGLGAAIMHWGRHSVVLLGVGLGLVTYAVAVLFYTWLGARRVRRQADPFWNRNTDVFSEQTGIPPTGPAGESDSRLSAPAGRL
jgi:hypothetical protein